jgi:enoyl-CoA hydratase
MTEVVTYESKGRIGYITLNRPEARNAVNGDVSRGVEAAIDAIEADDDVWVAILRANTEGQANPVFCAGADLKAVNAGKAGDLQTKRGGFGGIAQRERRKPIIVAIDGLATAGGCEITLACDIVVATTRSAFGLAEVKRNLIAGAGGLYRLPRAIGRSTAMYAILTGEPISAQRAYELGMVTSLVEPGQAEAEATRIAEQIAAAAPLAVYASREVVVQADWDTDANLQALTNKLFSAVIASEDTKEGLTAFIEKRPAEWKGR